VEARRRQAAEACLAGDNVPLVEIARQEHIALMGLIDILRREREAILSCRSKTSPDTREKETVLKTLVTLRKRRGNGSAVHPTTVGATDTGSTRP
jgi:hypothetical protein